jgi:hypothetical protein
VRYFKLFLKPNKLNLLKQGLHCQEFTPGKLLELVGQNVDKQHGKCIKMSKNRVKNWVPRNKLTAFDTFCRVRSGISVSKSPGKCHSVAKSWQCNPKIVRFLLWQSCQKQFQPQRILCSATQHTKFFCVLAGRQV